MCTQIPIFVTSTLFIFLLSILSFICQIKNSLFILGISFILLSFTLILWIRNLASDYNRMPNLINESLFIKGFYLFIITEILFFFSFFWTYYNFSIDSNYIIGGVWPPHYLMSSALPAHSDRFATGMNVALLSASLLVAIFSYITNISSILTKLTENELDYFNSNNRPYNISVTYQVTTFIISVMIFYGVYFINQHTIELILASYTNYTILNIPDKLFINDSIHASIYQIITGLHSMHVLIGMSLLYGLGIKGPYYNNNFLLATFYYWHLIDVIWIFVFNTQYIHYMTMDFIFFCNNIFILDTVILYA